MNFSIVRDHDPQADSATEVTPCLRRTVRWIGQLGGFQGRKRDGEPGAKMLWKGFQRLVDLTAMYHSMRLPFLGQMWVVISVHRGDGRG
ncbi:MAG: hypothetical protein NVS2B7_38700 [Herpetosiphon sp.]